MDLTWMAWTWQTALFFIIIGLSLVAMSLWEKFSPGGGPRNGILGLRSTRGDRLFISYLGSGWICLAWLFFFGAPLWGALIVCLFFAIAVFFFV